mmetsp:Transcript_46704/g.99910  ORF Transcript_46704/g.99910 Transcript_46704/m.99910 type:complete len:719 (-) Transcript_46704:35-2191(-)
MKHQAAFALPAFALLGQLLQLPLSAAAVSSSVASTYSAAASAAGAARNTASSNQEAAAVPCDDADVSVKFADGSSGNGPHQVVIHKAFTVTVGSGSFDGNQGGRGRTGADQGGRAAGDAAASTDSGDATGAGAVAGGGSNAQNDVAGTNGPAPGNQVLRGGVQPASQLGPHSGVDASQAVPGSASTSPSPSMAASSTSDPSSPGMAATTDDGTQVSGGGGTGSFNHGPAPAPSHQEPEPTSPPLISQAQDQLRTDHQSLSTASEDLIQVQDVIGTMENQLFGKVIDTDKVSDVYVQHERVVASNAKYEDDIKRLHEQITALSTQLAQMQRGYVEAGKQYRTEETRLRGSVVESDALLQGLENELFRGRGVFETHSMLQKAREGLVLESESLVKEGSSAVKELQDMEKASAVELAKSEELHRRLNSLNNDTAACQYRLKVEKNKLAAKTASGPKEEAATKFAREQAEASKKALEQRQTAAALILKNEVFSAENQMHASLKSLQTVQGRLRSTEAALVYQVKELNSKVNTSMAHAEVLAKALANSSGVNLDDELKRNETEVKLATLQQETSAVMLTALIAENEVFGQELNKLLANVTRFETEESTLTIAADQAEDELAAANATAIEAAKAAEEAVTEGRLQIATAQNETQKQINASNLLAERAQDSIAAKCADKWSARKATQDAALETCEKQRSELSVLKAQRETLEQTLKAQQTAAMAG